MYLVCLQYIVFKLLNRVADFRGQCDLTLKVKSGNGSFCIMHMYSKANMFYNTQINTLIYLFYQRVCTRSMTSYLNLKSLTKPFIGFLPKFLKKLASQLCSVISCHQLIAHPVFKPLSQVSN